eukprot:COSAG06_NODE_42383_length_382_cov_0.734982_1_plen_62_part_01
MGNWVAAPFWVLMLTGVGTAQSSSPPSPPTRGAAPCAIMIDGTGCRATATRRRGPASHRLSE